MTDFQTLFVCSVDSCVHRNGGRRASSAESKSLLNSVAHAFFFALLPGLSSGSTWKANLSFRRFGRQRVAEIENS